MDSLLLKTAKLTKSSGVNENHILQSLLHELKDGLGHVFALYYIEGRPNQARQQIAVIINDHIDRFHQTTTRGMNIARRFEHMLQAINDELALLGQDFQRIPISQLHCVFGVVTSNQLYLSGLGDLVVRYLHHTNQSRYAVYDLHTQFEPPESTSWEKVFITVLDGELHANDIFYIGLPLSAREIPEGDFQDILVTLPPASALKRIEQHTGAQQPYAGICMRTQSPRTAGQKKKINPITSIEELNATKTSTSSVLGESHSDFVGSVERSLHPFIQSLHRPGERGITAILRQTLRLFLKGFILLLQGIAWFISKAAPLARRAWGAATSDSARQAIRGGAQRFTSLAKSAGSASRRSYLTAFIILAILIVSGLGIRTIIRSSARQELIVQAEEIIDAATERRDQASARLIFNDRDGAQLLLTEALALLDTAPDVRTLSDEVTVLRESINEVLNETRGVLSPELTLLAESPTPLIKAAGSADSIVTLGDSNTVYRFNSATNAFDVLADQQSALGSLTHIATLDDTVYVADNNRQLGVVNGSNTVSAVTSGLNRLSDLSALGFYNGNMYAATNELQQIFRYLPQGASFDGGTSWIVSNDAPLDSAQDIAIDGDIYLLTLDNLYRYQSGRQTSFDIDTIDPSLSDATDLYTALGLDSLYILEPSQNRILVFSKETGAFLSQYIDERIGDAHSIIADEDNNTLYTVTGSGIYSFPLTHRL